MVEASTPCTPYNSEIYSLIPNYYAMKILFPITPSEESENKMEIYFGLDKSGSMAGGPISDARGALVSFIEKIEKLELDITLYCFNDVYEVVNSKSVGYGGLSSYVKGIKASGRTNFTHVVEAMEGQLVSSGCKRAFIIFLSDGQDNNGFQHVKPSLDHLQKVINEGELSVSIHTIGFSWDHDAVMLSMLTQYGTKEGSFQFIPSGGRIPVAVNNVYEFLYGSSAWARVRVGGQPPKKINLQEEEALTGVVFLTEDEIPNVQVELHQGGVNTQFKVLSVNKQFQSLQDEVHIFGMFVSEKVLQIMEGSRGDAVVKEQLQNSLDFVSKIDQKMSSLVTQCKKLKGLLRKQIMPFCDCAQELISNVYATAFESMEGNLTNLHYAQLNNLAHQNLLKRSLQKKIAKRAGSNMKLLQDIEEYIDNKLSLISIPELREKYPDAEELGQCMISYKNWIECVEVGDCLCLTFNIERPESGIHDPSLLKIHEINTTLLSAENFIDSALFSTKAGQIIQGAGFEKGRPANTLVNGLPQEVITGILPMYICEEHWSIAKERMKPLLGWTVTLDVLGYGIDQLLILPFLLLAKSYMLKVTNKDSQFRSTQHTQILDICRAVYANHKQKLLPKLKKIVESYENNPGTRTTDAIPNNRVLVCQLWVACEVGDLDMNRVIGLFRYILEEEIRRYAPSVPKGTYHDLVVQILDISHERHVSGYMQEVIKSLEGSQDKKYELRFQQLLGGEMKDMDIEESKSVMGVHKEQEKVSDNVQELFGVDINKLSEKAQKYLAKVQILLGSNGSYIGETNRLFTMFQDTKAYPNLFSMGVETNAQLLMFIFQNIFQKRNKERREWIEKKRWVNIFSGERSYEGAYEVFAESVRVEREAAKTKYISAMHAGEFEKNAVQFALTHSLDEAAGIIHGSYQGNKFFKQLYTSLSQSGVPAIISKLTMLTTGAYKGVKLILDKVPQCKKEGDFVVWRPTKSKAYRIWIANIAAGTLDQWISALPHLEAYFIRQHQRKQGHFVKYSKPKKNCKDKRLWE